MDVKEKVCVWADGTWCYLDELWEMTHMSDDYVVLEYEDFLLMYPEAV